MSIGMREVASDRRLEEPLRRSAELRNHIISFDAGPRVAESLTSQSSLDFSAARRRRGETEGSRQVCDLHRSIKTPIHNTCVRLATTGLKSLQATALIAGYPSTQRLEGAL